MNECSLVSTRFSFSKIDVYLIRCFMRLTIEFESEPERQRERANVEKCWCRYYRCTQCIYTRRLLPAAHSFIYLFIFLLVAFVSFQLVFMLLFLCTLLNYLDLSIFLLLLSVFLPLSFVSIALADWLAGWLWCLGVPHCYRYCVSRSPLV